MEHARAMLVALAPTMPLVTPVKPWEPEYPEGVEKPPPLPHFLSLGRKETALRDRVEKLPPLPHFPSPD
eukprot:6479616-Pyramimonas_sp.AAC.1